MQRDAERKAKRKAEDLLARAKKKAEDQLAAAPPANPGKEPGEKPGNKRLKKPRGKSGNTHLSKAGAEPPLPVIKPNDKSGNTPLSKDGAEPPLPVMKASRIPKMIEVKPHSPATQRGTPRIFWSTLGWNRGPQYKHLS